MSEVTIKVGLDASEALAAAEQLPGAIDRRARQDAAGGPTLRPVRKPGTVEYEWLTDREIAVRKWRERQRKDEENAARERSRASDAAANDSKKWMKQFGDELGETLMRTITPAALAAKAIELGWGSVIRMVENMIATGNTKLEAGVNYANTRALEMFANVGTASNEEVRAMAANAQRVANAVASGGPGSEGARGYAYFGMTDFKKYREEGVPMAELISNMAKRYQKEGGGPEYEAMATQVLGPNWRKLSALIATEAEAQTKGRSAMEDIESGPTMSAQYATALAYRAKAYQMTPGQLMGGLPGGGPSQMLSNVSSLQAMGGGDILSAIARGPQERTADASEAIERNTQEMANAMKGNYVAPYRPVIIGK